LQHWLRAWKPVDSVGGANAAAIEQLLAAAPRMHLLECNAHLRGKDGGSDDASFVVGWYCACCASRSALLRLRKLTINA
jgi:hypothetical protein